jgi:hypothetical protein
VIYIDANNNNQRDSGEKTATSNSSGVYTLSGLGAGTYIVRRHGTPANYTITTGSNGDHNVTLSAGQDKTGVNVGAALK